MPVPRLRAVLGGVGEALVTAGVLILAFVAYQLWGTGFYEARQQRALLERFEAAGSPGGRNADRPPSGPRPGTPEVGPGEPRPDTFAPAGGAVPRETGPESLRQPGSEQPVAAVEGIVGVISIPSLGIERAVVDGVSPTDLRQGPGHYPGTALPGGAGNAAIAGHRTTYGAPFNRLDELDPGDTITLSTPTDRFVYRVTGSAIVAPTAVEVLDPTPDNRLTLTTCHPKFSDRQRLVVTAALVGAPEAPALAEQRPAVRAKDAPIGDPAPRALPDSRPSRLGADRGFDDRRSPGAAAAWGLSAAAIGGTWRWIIGRRRHWSRFVVGLPPFLGTLLVFYAKLELLLPSNF